MLFRLSLPRVLQVSDDFATMYQKSLNKSRGQFLRLVLMQNIKQIDPHDKQSILFY